MNDYEVTFANGQVVEVSAWTPEAAIAIAEEEGEMNGCEGVAAVSASLLATHATEF
jgi:hypothetical protein